VRRRRGLVPFRVRVSRRPRTVLLGLRARPSGRELEQWDEIKVAAAEAIAALGGTITHHHAVGRDHRRWYLREVPQLFAGALRGAKAELDPAGIMNPGVLLEPTGGTR